MRNPFLKKMPLQTDVKIRWRLFLAWCQRHKTAFLSMLAVPVIAAMLVLVVSTKQSPFNSDLFVTEVHAAQVEIAEKASVSVYYVEREVREGKDKIAYVADTTGKKVANIHRVDTVQSYQHNETAITRINSNTAERPFEVFLSVAHDDVLEMHHFGPVENAVTSDRAILDSVHNIRSVYESFTTLETPNLPLLPVDAQLVAVNEEGGIATFMLQKDSLEIEFDVDLFSYEVVAERLYVNELGERYEMVSTTYTERAMVPANQFDTVFAADQYEFELIATADQPNT